MTKGLIRSKGRASPMLEVLKKEVYQINESVTIANTQTIGAATISGLPEGNIITIAAVANNLTVRFTDPSLVPDGTFYGIAFSYETIDTSQDFFNTTYNPITASPLGTTASGVVTGARIAVAPAAADKIQDNTANSLSLNVGIGGLAALPQSVNAVITGEIYLLYSILGDD